LNRIIVWINNSLSLFSIKFIVVFFSIELKDAFALFDRLGGGVISTKDLAFVMRSIGYQTTPSELEQMIQEVDQDGSSLFFITIMTLRISIFR
jgi:Ca2+-binding EF-hand superfamily protein